MVTRYGARPRCQPNNIDFLTLIAELTKELHRSISITWVKAHQDEGSQVGTLTRYALNNIAVDALATLHRTERRLLPRQQIPHLAPMKCSISLNGLILPGHFNTMLRYHINGYHLRAHMQTKFSWSDLHWLHVDLPLFSAHFRSISANLQVQRMKFVYDQQPLGARTSKYSSLVDPATVDKCPCSSIVSREDQTHLLRCTINPAHSTAIRAFQKSLHARDLHAVFYLISFGILHWITGEVPLSSAWDLRGYPSHMHADILIALQQQESIGWLSGLKGFLSIHWKIVAGMSMHDPSVNSSVMA